LAFGVLKNKQKLGEKKSYRGSKVLQVKGHN